MKKYFMLLLAFLLVAAIEAVAQERGYHGTVEIGPTMLVSGMEETAFGATVYTSHGYQFCPEFFVGVGVGAFGFLNNEAGGVGGIGGVPLYLNLQSYLTRKDVAPYVDLKVGYALFDYDGLYLSPTVGVQLLRNERAALRIGLNYSHVGIRDSYINEQGSRSTDRWYLHWLGLHLGLTFGGRK